MDQLTEHASKTPGDGELLAALNDHAASLVRPSLLRSPDSQVKLLTACCLAEMLRIYAPDAPYSADQIQVKTKRKIRKKRERVF